jgi:heme-degrading monooxygenase HmoA
MLSRIITCTIDPAKINEFRTALNDEYLPRIQSQPGFVDNIESLDTNTGKYCCVTMWESPADVQNYDNGLFKEIAANLGPMMTDVPTVETLPVENSSMHHVKTGRAAA